MNGVDDDAIRADRQAHLDRILGSAHPRKVVVAGPGAGKTHTFKEVLRQASGSGLALTFLLGLVRDLAKDLTDLADVYSFHGFARRLLHQRQVNGLTREVQYFPLVGEIYGEDILCRVGVAIDPHSLGRLFRSLADDNELLQLALASGSYYNTVGHDDSVYRVLRHLEAHGDVPRFSQVVVDEFQDFSPLEVAVIEVLASASPILIAGDDDQALYAFREATPEAIRALVLDEAWERHELPYCSRCTAVLVQATHTVVQRAQAVGLLDGRIEKRFECFLPDKRVESDLYPDIIHARCSVQVATAPYMSRYIEHRIRQLDPADVVESHEKGYPTVLVIAPNPFHDQIATYLRQHFKNVRSRDRTPQFLTLLDAYRILARDASSRLGWRVLIHVEPPDQWQHIIVTALDSGMELVDLVPEDYRIRHLALADILRRLRDDEAVNDAERTDLANVLGVATELLSEEISDEEPPEEEVDPDEPTILLTSLMGSKGLQAGHVFIAGVNGGHFPRHNDDPTNEEVCQLLVALTRARKSCSVVSCWRLGGVVLDTSRFVEWLAPQLSTVKVDKQFFQQIEA